MVSFFLCPLLVPFVVGFGASGLAPRSSWGILCGVASCAGLFVAGDEKGLGVLGCLAFALSKHFSTALRFKGDRDLVFLSASGGSSSFPVSGFPVCPFRCALLRVSPRFLFGVILIFAARPFL